MIVSVTFRPHCRQHKNADKFILYKKTIREQLKISTPTSRKVAVILKGKVKGKAVPLQAWTGPEGSRKLRFPDFVTTAQDGGRFSALRTGCLYPQEIFLVLISVRG